MTRASAIASILKKLGDAHYQAADELLALASDDTASPVRPAGSEAAVSPAAAPTSLPPSIDELPFDDALIPDEFQAQPSLSDESVEFAPQGSEAVCPKHRRPYKEGRYGPFCTAQTDDAAWGKERDGKLWCKITPKNAAVWLRNQAAAA